MAETNLNGLETMCHLNNLMLKLYHLNIIHKLFLVLIAVPVCLTAGVRVFLSGVFIISWCDKLVNILIVEASELHHLEQGVDFSPFL